MTCWRKGARKPHKRLLLPYHRWRHYQWIYRQLGASHNAARTMWDRDPVFVGLLLNAQIKLK